MKTLFTLSFLLFLSFTAYTQNRFWVAGATGNWNNTANWSTTNGGAGGASVPGAANTAIFNGNGLGNCNLDISPTVAAIQLNAGYTGTVDLQGNTITVNGTSSFSSGNINNSGGAASVALNSLGTTTFNGTTFGADITGNSDRIFFSGSVFNGDITLTKTDNNNDTGAGGNTFNGTVSIVHNGTGEFRLGDVTPDVFNNTLTMTLNNTGDFVPAYTAAGTLFNGNIVINYNNTGDVRFGANGGTSQLNDPFSITVNCAATGCDDLQLENFTWLTTAPQSISLSGSGNATLTFGPNSTFTPPLTCTAEGIVFNTSTFNGAGSFTQTGTNTTNSVGPNVFNDDVIITNTGADVYLGNSGTGDTFNGDLTLNNSGGNRIRLGENTAGNVVFGNLTANNTSVTDVNNRIQISRFSGSSTTIHGTATFNNAGLGSDFHICYDAGSLTTFNGPVVINNSASNPEVQFGRDGNVIFNGDLTIDNPIGSNISLSAGTGSVTYGNGIFSVLTFSTGVLEFNNFSQPGTGAINITLTGTAEVDVNPGTVFNGPVTIIAPQFDLDGGTFNNTAYIEKTGTTTNTGDGGSTFNGATTIVNSGSGSLDFGNLNPDFFGSSLTVNNTGTSRIQFAVNSAGNIFNGPVIVNHGGNSPNVNFVVARNAGSSATFNSSLTLNASNLNTASGIVIGNDGVVSINGNVTVTSTAGRGVLFANTSGSVTLQDGYTITTGGVGTFTTGTLSLTRFTQVGGTPQNIMLDGTASLILGPTATFNGDVDYRAPQIFLNGATYNGAAYIEKTGATDNTGTGGNVFNGITTLANSGNNYLLTGNTSRDVFNDDLTVTSSGDDIIYLAYNTANNEFNGNITFNSTGASTGIYVCNQTGSSATLGVGAQLQIGTFNTGRLRLRSITQLGSEDQNLLLTNTALLEIGPATSFNGNVDFSAPQFELDGVTFNGPTSTTLAKTGATNNDSQGGNIFNSPLTTISNSGSGYFRFAQTSLDTFNNDVEFISTSSGTIRVANNIPGTVFNGNVFVNSTGTGGIYFSESAGGTCSIVDGKSISVGATGFTGGELRIRRLTQSDATTPQTINMSSAGTGLLLVGPSVSFAGAVDFRAPQIQLSGATYNNTAYIEKSGATDNTSAGGNEFIGATTLVNSGSGLWTMSSPSADIFRSSLTVNNTGTNRIFLADGSAGNLFEGDVTVNYGGATAGGNNFHIVRNAGATAIFSGTVTLNCTNATANSGIVIANDGAATFNGNIHVTTTNGRGVLFGSATGTMTQPSGLFTVGTFNTGLLSFRNFTKGNNATALTLSGSASITVNTGVTFNGDLTVSAPRVNLNGGTFNGTTSFTKTTTGNDDNTGGNTFNGTTTLTNNTTGRWRLANTTGDTFTGPVTFNKTSTGAMDIAYNGTNNFGADITIGSNTALTFGAGTGIIRLSGGNSQSINRTDAFTHNITRLVIDKTAQQVNLNMPINVTVSATFTNGILNTTTTNLLNFANGATTSGANHASFVDGPVRKTGNAAFTFPIGDNNFYRPLGISAPTGAAHYFDAQYFNADHGLGTTANYDPAFWVVSGCEYWNLTRNAGASSDVFVTLSWLEAACNPGYITTPADIRVTRWNGTMWTNAGNSAVSGTATDGTVTSGAAITSFSPFTLASVTSLNPLPIELMYFRGNLSEQNQVYLEWKTATEENNDHFTLERSFNGRDFDFLKKIAGSGTRLEPKVYSYIDADLVNYSGDVYYKLSQTDYDGTKKTLDVTKIQIHDTYETGFVVYPNPTNINKITVEGRFGNKNTAALIDMTGRTVQSFDWAGGIKQVELSIKDLPSGSYILRLQTSEGLNETKRLVVLER